MLRPSSTVRTCDPPQPTEGARFDVVITVADPASSRLERVTGAFRGRLQVGIGRGTARWPYHVQLTREAPVTSTFTRAP